MFCFGLNHMKHCVISLFSLFSHRKRLSSAWACLSPVTADCQCSPPEYIQLGSTLTADLSLQKHATSLSSCAAWHHPHGVYGTAFHFFLELVMLEIYAQSKKKSRGIPHHRISIQMYNYNMMHLIFSQWPTLHAGTFAVLDLGYWWSE